MNSAGRGIRHGRHGYLQPFTAASGRRLPSAGWPGWLTGLT